MEITIINKKIFGLMIGFASLLVSACSDKITEPPVVDPDKPQNPEVIKSILERAVVDWGISKDELVVSMNGYDQVKVAQSDMMLFKAPKGKQGISYSFKDGKLCATSVVFPKSSTEVDLQSLWKDYSYVGDLIGAKVYNCENKNTMAAVFETLDNDSLSCAVGFAPIKSDLFEEVEPIVVTTGDIVIDVCSAAISGKISGVDKDVEVGVIYGRTGDLSESRGTKVSTMSSGNFEVTIKGLIDEQTYYYRAYAVIDGFYYWGEIKKLMSKPVTYTIDGKTFKMVRIEGEEFPTFYIMQTELPSSSNILIGSYNIEKLNSDDNRAVTRREFKLFLDNIKNMTGLPFRLPTKEEWQYAAKGGVHNDKYIYSGSDDVEEVAWYNGNSGKNGHTVATKKANALGIYDMSGNYSEVCCDSETNDNYSVDGPICGGSWNDAASKCKVTSWVEGNKNGMIPTTNSKELGSFDAKYITVRLVYSAE